MNLIDAALCLDCEEIYVRKHYNDGCPACGGRQSAPIVRFLKSIQSNQIRKAIAGINTEGPSQKGE